MRSMQMPLTLYQGVWEAWAVVSRDGWSLEVLGSSSSHPALVLQVTHL